MAFVKLNKGITAEQINAQFATYIKPRVKANGFGTLISLHLQPLTDIHFTSDYYRGDDGDNFRKAHLPTLYALMGIALFILIIAAINFINLSALRLQSPFSKPLTYYLLPAVQSRGTSRVDAAYR